MNDTETWAKRIVAGGELYLRRRLGMRWEINFYERVWNVHTALLEGVLRSERLADHHFRGMTFASPDEAAEVVRGLVCR